MPEHERDARQLALLDTYERALALDPAAAPPPGLDPDLATVAEILARQLSPPPAGRGATPDPGFRAALRDRLAAQAARYPTTPVRTTPLANGRYHDAGEPATRQRAPFGPRDAVPVAPIAGDLPIAPPPTTPPHPAARASLRPYRRALSTGASWAGALLAFLAVLLVTLLLLRGLPVGTPAAQPTALPTPRSEGTPAISSTTGPTMTALPTPEGTTGTPPVAAPLWQPTSALAAPRAEHTATRLADGRILVAGGEGDGGPTASAEIYDPRTGRWSPTGAMGAVRVNHAALLLRDGRVLVAGRFYTDAGGGASIPHGAEIYDPVTGAWRAAAAPPVGLGGVAMAPLADGRVLVLASTPVGTPPEAQVTTALIYDPAADRWASLGAVALAGIPDVVVLPDGRALLLGAANQENDGTTPALLLDPATGRATPAPLPDARGGFSVNLLPDGGVLVAGGTGWIERSVGQATTLDTSLRFDPASGRWADGPRLTFPRTGQATAPLADGRVLLVGGDTPYGQARQTTAEFYDPQTGRWAAAGTLTGTTRARFAVASLADGRAIVVGGDAGFVRSAWLSTTELFTPPARTTVSAATATPRPAGWRTGAPLSGERNALTLTTLRDGTALAVGGGAVAGSVAATERYDPATDRWVATGNLNAPRQGHAAAALRDGRVLVVGGVTPSAPGFGTAEVYDPATGRWAMVAPPPQSFERTLAAVLADGRVVVVGATIAGTKPESGVASFLYDPAADRWSVPVSLPAQTVSALVALPDGRAFLAANAGQRQKPNGRDEPLALLFDPREATWQAGTPPTASFLGAAATLLPDGTVFVAGGSEPATNAAAPVSLPRADRYDPTADRWAVLTPLSVGRSAAGVVALTTGQVLVVGGDRMADTPTGTGYTGRADLYDPAANRWLAAGSLAVGRESFGLAPLPNGEALAAGGGFVQANSVLRFSTVDRFTAPAAGASQAGAIPATGAIDWSGPGTGLLFFNGHSYRRTTRPLPDGGTPTIGQQVGATILRFQSGDVFPLGTPVYGVPGQSADDWLMLRDGDRPVAYARSETATTLLAGLQVVAGTVLDDGATVCPAYGCPWPGAQQQPGTIATAHRMRIGRVYQGAPTPGAPIEVRQLGAPDAGMPDGRPLPLSRGNAVILFLQLAQGEAIGDFGAGDYYWTGPGRAYWEAHGGLARNGYPLTGEMVEQLEEGQPYQVQYFERVRLEFHPEATDPAYRVQLGQFGRRVLADVPKAPIAAVPRRDGATYFAETGHNVGPRFGAYWRDNGGLAQFGFPLTEPFEQRLEDGTTYQVQYFERARFELHPENPAPYDILLGQFGRRILAGGAPRALALDPASGPCPAARTLVAAHGSGFASGMTTPFTIRHDRDGAITGGNSAAGGKSANADGTYDNTIPLIGCGPADSSGDTFTITVTEYAPDRTPTNGPSASAPFTVTR